MAKGIYVGINEAEKLVNFTSSIVPTIWTNSSDDKSATATNDYGEWKVEASYVFSSVYPVSSIFDVEEGINVTSWVAKADTQTVAYTSKVWLNPPTDRSIKPAKLSITYQALGDNNSIWGMNANTGEYEEIASWSNTAASGERITKTITYSGGSYFSKIEIRVSNFGYGNEGSVSDFKITSGTLKYEGKNNIAHKVKKAYIGVDSKARKVKKGYIGVGGVARLFYDTATYIEFTSCPYLTVESDWEVVTANTDYTYTNTYGTWRVSADNSYNIAYTACRAVDNDSDTSWRSKNNYDWLYLTFPDGVTINPKTIYIKGTDNSSKRNFSIVGVKPDGNTEVIAQNDGTQSFIHKFTINTDSYFTKLQVRSGNNALFIRSFHITAGTMKIEE